ncbi:MAG: HlyD family efflux transporter periplasmic adaptor subunit [Chlorobium phaeovibrioides]|nr:HlyD family efflux transporter periplasmic adaptor subunit [Chlorobium phaeovibrioides]
MRSKRLFSFLAALAILIAGFVIAALLGRKQPSAKKPEASTTSAFQPAPLDTVSNGRVFLPLKMSGPIEALRKIEIYAEVSGVFRDAARPFREGTWFRKGQTLLLLDDAVYRNSVLAEKSRLLSQLTLVLPDLIIDFPEESEKWKAYVGGFRIDSPLSPLPAPSSDRERNYLAARGIYDSFYAVRSMEETLGRYRITAPFDGQVTLSSINPGTLVRTGQKIGEFAAPGRYELEASMGLRDAGFLKPGSSVMLLSEDVEGTFKGVVRRVNRAISSATQTVSVFVEVNDSRLSDGMFLSAQQEIAMDSAFVVPRRLLRQDDRLFVIEDSLVALRQVRVVMASDDRAAVRGLGEGTFILLDPDAGVREGMDASPLLKQTSSGRVE